VRRAGWPVLVASAWTVLLFLMLPTLVAVPVSLTPERFLSLPRGGISFRHYATLLGDPAWRDALVRSFWIGLAASASAVTVGTLAAVAIWRLASRLAEAVRLAALAPMIVPPIVSALAFYKAWAGYRMLDTYAGVVLAHAVLALPYVLVAVSASLATVDPRQEQASRSLGASPALTIRRVILPQILPGVATGGVFAFIVSWDEIVVTLFVATRRVYTLPRKMWDGIQERIDPTIAAAATVLFLVTVAVIAARVAWQGRRREAP
jgi:putative spermidine/putrescine transport system permease protein